MNKKKILTRKRKYENGIKNFKQKKKKKKKNIQNHIIK